MWDSRRSSKQKGYELCMLSDYFRNGIIIGVLFSWGSLSLFSGKVSLKTVFEPFSLPRCRRNFVLRMEILSRNSLYVLCIYKQPTEYASKRASQQVGGYLTVVASSNV